jgi:hypothetical protein
LIAQLAIRFAQSGVSGNQVTDIARTSSSSEGDTHADTRCAETLIENTEGMHELFESEGVPQPDDAVEKVIGAGSFQTRRKNDAIRSPIHDRR